MICHTGWQDFIKTKHCISAELSHTDYITTKSEANTHQSRVQVAVKVHTAVNALNLAEIKAVQGAASDSERLSSGVKYSTYFKAEKHAETLPVQNT